MQAGLAQIQPKSTQSNLGIYTSCHIENLKSQSTGMIATQ